MRIRSDDAADVPADRRYAGREIGSHLLAYARSLAVEHGVDLIRVDCFRGGDFTVKTEHRETQDTGARAVSGRMRQ